MDNLAGIPDLLKCLLAGFPDLRERLLDLIGALKGDALSDGRAGHSVCSQMLGKERKQLRRRVLSRPLDIEALRDGDARKADVERLALGADTIAPPAAPPGARLGEEKRRAARTLDRYERADRAGILRWRSSAAHVATELWAVAAKGKVGRR
jgi:hypothetical protein